MIPECPDVLRELVGPGEWVPYSRPPSHPDGEQPTPDPDAAWVDHTWTGRSWIGERHLIRADAVHPHSTVDDHERTAWLASALASDDDAEAARSGDDTGGSVVEPGWYARPLPAGTPAHRPDLHPRPDVVPAAIGHALRRLHAIDPADCPYASARDVLVAEITEQVEAGRLVPELLPGPYDRYPAERLLELIDEAPLVDEAPVIGHGSAVLANFWSADGEPVTDGLLGLHRLGVTDRHADLAVVHRQLQTAFGPEAVFAFYEAYGRDPHLVLLDHHLLIDAVRSALVP